jgi:hypothetical protein
MERRANLAHFGVQLGKWSNENTSDLSFSNAGSNRTDPVLDFGRHWQCTLGCLMALCLANSGVALDQVMLLLCLSSFLWRPLLRINVTSCNLLYVRSCQQL